MAKIVRLTEQDLVRLVNKVINEQSFGAVVTPDVVENYFRKNIMTTMDLWSSVEDLNKLYNSILPLSGKRVKGVSKCFNEEWQTGGKPINKGVLEYIDQLNYWQLQDKCGEETQGPSYSTLADEVNNVGTRTLGKEGVLIKKKILDLLLKNGVKPTVY